jgi:cytoskeletal protein RodZ
MKKTQVEVESRVVTGAHGVAAEEDHVKLGKVMSVGVASMVLFAVGGFAAYLLQVRTEREAQPQGPAATPAAIGQYEVGIVNQRVFEADTHAREKLEAQRQALQNGWGDRPGEVVFTPIDKAMEQVISHAQTQKDSPPVPSPELSPGSMTYPPPRSPRTRL